MEHKEKRELEKEVEAIAVEVLNQTHSYAVEVENVIIHSELGNAPTNYTGVYASISFHASGVTQQIQNLFAERGLHHVETATHVVPNPDMDSDIEEVSIDELHDAAETDVELVVELDDRLLN